MSQPSKWKGASPPTRFVLVTSRALTNEELSFLAKNFKSPIEYNAALQGVLDVSKATFDLLVVNGFPPENHRFLEIIKPRLAELGICPIVLRQRFSQSDALAEDLEAAHISRIEDLVGPDFIAALQKPRLRKLKPRWQVLLRACFGLASKA